MISSIYHYFLKWTVSLLAYFTVHCTKPEILVYSYVYDMANDIMCSEYYIRVFCNILLLKVN